MNRPIHPKQVENTPIADPLDRMLDAHFAGPGEDIVPSSGFVHSVMESIQAQATEPSPITFPWRRVVPGAIAIICGLIALITSAVRTGAASGPAIPSRLHLALSLKPAFTPTETALGWVLLAACLSITAIAASFRLTGRSQ